MNSGPIHLETDTHVAAYLLAKGHAFVGLQPAGGGRLDFKFEDADGLTAKDAASFYRGATVKAEHFAACLRRMKAILYSQKSETGRDRQSDYPRTPPRS